MIFYKENKSKNELTKLLFNWPLWLIGFSFCLGFVFYQLIIQKKIEGIVKRYNHFENMVKTAFQYHSTPPNRLVIHTAVSLRNSFKQKKDYGENTTLLEQPISAQLFYDNHFYDLKIDPNQKEKILGEFLGRPPFWPKQGFLLTKDSPYLQNYNWILHQLAKKESLITEQKFPVELFLDERKVGFYQVEPLNGKIIYNAAKIKGPVVQLKNLSIIGNTTSFALSTLSKNKTNVYKQFIGFDLAMIRLNNFLNKKKVELNKLFDYKKLAKYFSILDLTFGNQAFDFLDTYFVYNVQSQLFEPIVLGLDRPIPFTSEEMNYFERYDVSLYRDWIFSPHKDILAPLLTDLNFSAIYLSTLDHLTAPEFWKSFTAESKENQNRYHSYLVAAHQKYLSFNIQEELQQLKIEQVRRRILRPVVGAYSYFHTFNQKTLTLKVSNRVYTPVELLEIEYNGEVLFTPVEKTILTPRYFETPQVHKLISFNAKKNIDIKLLDFSKLLLVQKIPGINRFIKTAIHPYQMIDDKVFMQADLLRKKSNLKNFPFLEIVPQSKNILVKKGYWKLDSDLVIPAGHLFNIGEGTTFDLVNNASLISFSPVLFKGTKNNPIKIISSDASGQGLAIIAAKASPSLFDYVIIDGQKNPSKKFWELTGAVTFYESNISILNSKFLNNKSEDGLNIVRSHFSISHSEFKNSFSDALDVDFGRGSVTNVSFSHLGNDALDFSGGKIKVSNVSVFYAKDKGISAGENSEVNVSDTVIEHSNFGFVSKDQSLLSVRDSIVKDSNMAFSAYRKKEVFGPGTIYATNILMKNNKENWVIEQKSILRLEDSIIKGDLKNLGERFY